MTVIIRALLHCDLCGDFFRTDAVPQDASARDARRAARRRGWVLKVVDGRRRDICDNCGRSEE